MGKKDETKRGNGAATIQEPAEERTQATPEPERAPEEAPQGAPVGETTATEAPAEEPGPEDFEKHDGKRLISDQEADLKTQEAVEERLKKRGHVIATRARLKGGPNAIVMINGKPHQPRARPANSGGGMLLAEVKPRVEASIDP